MDASQHTTEPLRGVEMSQGSDKLAEGAAPAEEQLPLPPDSDPIGNVANPKPKRGPKVAPNADRPPGKSLLPIARVQKILKADKELPTCAKEAVFLISVATEEFIKRLGQAGQQQAVREKRTTVQRRDVATAVRRSDEFAFLEEILATGIPAAPVPAPVKRKAKPSATANDNKSIMDAFGKGKEKATAGPDDAVDAQQAAGWPDDYHEMPSIAHERRDGPPSQGDTEIIQPTQGEQEKSGNEMDIS